MEQAGTRAGPWSGGTQYEAYVGRWSRLVARRFLPVLAAPGGWQWLDVGCGTGALTGEVLAACAPTRVLGVDRSADFVASAAAHVRDPRAEFRQGDAQDLPVADASFDAAVCGLVLNFLPQPATAVEEMRRAVRPGGVVAAYVWDYAEGMQMMRRFWDAAGALDPRARELDEGRRFSLCKPEPLADLLGTVGLRGVEVHAIEVPTVFRDFDDYWSPFLGGQGPAPGYAMALSEERRAALRERVRASLPTASKGGHHLMARAWAARGVR